MEYGIKNMDLKPVREKIRRSLMIYKSRWLDF